MTDDANPYSDGVVPYPTDKDYPFLSPPPPPPNRVFSDWEMSDVHLFLCSIRAFFGRVGARIRDAFSAA
jgi:hypothetical protein